MAQKNTLHELKEETELTIQRSIGFAADANIANPKWIAALRIAVLVIDFLLSQAVSPDGRIVIPKLWRISFYIEARRLFIRIKDIINGDKVEPKGV